MALRDGDHNLVVTEMHLLEAGERIARPGRSYAEFGPPGAHEVAHDHGVRDDQLDRQVAPPQLLVFDEPAREHELGDRVADRETDGSVLAREAGHQLLDGVGLREQLARLDVQALARLGRGDPTGRPDQELGSRQGLERAHPLRERGLANAKESRGAPEAAEVDRGAEGAQLGEIDGPHEAHNPRIGPTRG